MSTEEKISELQQAAFDLAADIEKNINKKIVQQPDLPAQKIINDELIHGLAAATVHLGLIHQIVVQGAEDANLSTN